jgi:hypothetical protein
MYVDLKVHPTVGYLQCCFVCIFSIKKGLRTGLLIDRLISTGAVGKFLRRTHYFQVGNRCLCPKVLSSRRFRSSKAWFPGVRISVLSNRTLHYVHRRVQPALSFIANHISKINENIGSYFNCGNFKFNL